MTKHLLCIFTYLGLVCLGFLIEISYTKEVYLFIYILDVFLLTFWSVIWLGWLYNDTQDLTPNDYVCLFVESIFKKSVCPTTRFLKTSCKIFNGKKCKSSFVINRKQISRFLHQRIFWISDAVLIFVLIIFLLHLLLVSISRRFCWRKV